MKNPRLRPIGDLLEENFFIPRYQRGYRWGKQEVTDLLNDLLQYTQNSKLGKEHVSVGEFYCLQPIVVKKKNWKRTGKEDLEGWELIDGQQRLTTLYIILVYLEEVRQFYDNSKQLYTIDFETREECIEFFNEREFKKQINDSNVDFFHISKSYEIIEDWFKDKLTERLDMLKTILGETKNASIIWYEANIEEDFESGEKSSIELFTRLNEGKIPLTDAELIKALLLQADLYKTDKKELIEQRLFEIASEWDEIEANLQNDKFWFFINETNYQPTTRIEFIFKILAEKWNNLEDEKLINYSSENDKPKNFDYLVFDRYLSLLRETKKDSHPNKEFTISPVNEIWDEIKSLFSKIEEWYNDHTLYHYIGYLFAVPKVNKSTLLNDLINLKKSKPEFLKHVKFLIKEQVEIKAKHKDSDELKGLNAITYGEDNESLLKILLLFNVETLVRYKTENARFPFHLFKEEKISSLEHIHPQNPEKIDTNFERSVTWLKSHNKTLKNLEVEDLKTNEEIKILIERTENQIIYFNKEEFKILYADLIDRYTAIVGFNENEIDTLYNLALVDRDTNSSLNNSFFDVKREILKDDKLEKYVPINTQRAFSKYYSTNPHEMIFWSEHDRKMYYNQIEKVYSSFINL